MKPYMFINLRVINVILMSPEGGVAGVTAEPRLRVSIRLFGDFEVTSTSLIFSLRCDDSTPVFSLFLSSFCAAPMYYP